MPTKTAFVTGASSGIGQAIVKILENDEWHIIGPGHEELDLNDLYGVTLYADKIKQGVTKLDAFVHVAGVWHQGDKLLSGIHLGKFTDKEITETINVGMTSVLVLLNKLMPIMPGAAVIGISGTFSHGAQGWLPYYVSKRALEDLLVGLSQDNDKLNVFGVSPADTATVSYDQFFPEYSTEAQAPETVAELVKQLIDGKTEYKSGDIIELRDGKNRKGFHV